MKNIFKATLAVAAVGFVGTSAFYTQKAYDVDLTGEKQILQENILAFS